VSANAGELEERTRVTCHLPLSHPREELAFKDVIEHLEAQRRQRVGVDGYTYSNPTAFTGRWWSSDRRGWMADRIVLLIVDYRIELTDPRASLLGTVEELKAVIHDAYRRRGRPQEEVWVVSARVTRHT
jgi:hypothetical protein